ncbi:MAG: SEC-C domain-containing protein [Clostridia bacterium]|nr:SEC-C domain-containing protein [Clostridia bacterium]
MPRPLGERKGAFGGNAVSARRSRRQGRFCCFRRSSRDLDLCPCGSGLKYKKCCGKNQ